MLITDTSTLERFSSCHRLWQGIPGVAITDAGRILVCFYSGSVKETYGNYAVIVERRESSDFGEPIAAAYAGENARCFDPVLWIDPLGRLWFFWNVNPGDSVIEDHSKGHTSTRVRFYLQRSRRMISSRAGSEAKAILRVWSASLTVLPMQTATPSPTRAL